MREYLAPTTTISVRTNIQKGLTAPLIFSSWESAKLTDQLNFKCRKSRGQLRTKIEFGEGTIPVKNSDGIQTWDGVMLVRWIRLSTGPDFFFLKKSLFDRLLYFIGPTSANDVVLRQSCKVERAGPARCSPFISRSTDIFAINRTRWPIASWSHVQVQSEQSGNENLNNAERPLAFILSRRAVCGRVENAIKGLPPPYHLNRPELALVTSAETRSPIKAPSFGINWTYGCDHAEIVNSITGKTIDKQISRITKQAFFVKYANLIKALPNICVPRDITGDYSDVKASARNYQVDFNELDRDAIISMFVNACSMFRFLFT